MNCKSIGSSISHFFSTNCNYRDNSALPKALSLIPIIGSFVHWHKSDSMIEDLRFAKNAKDPIKMIEIAQLGKQYELLGIGRNLISIAIVITLTALGILFPIAGIFLGALSAACIYMAGSKIQAFQKIIDRLQVPSKPINSEQSPKKTEEAAEKQKSTKTSSDNLTESFVDASNKATG